MKQRGFTIIELLVAVVFLTGVGFVFLSQFNAVKTAGRDDTRRSAINAMYYDLEDVYYAKNSSYPKTIDEKNLTSMDKALFTDPEGNKIGSSASDYRYEPKNCSDTSCKSYVLRSSLENEADFVKTSRN